MRVATVKREATPADRRRQAVALERATRVLPTLVEGLDNEAIIEACRAGIRDLAQRVKAIGGEGRATGVLCGALVEVSPAYRAEKPAIAQAEALFAKGEG